MSETPDREPRRSVDPAELPTVDAAPGHAASSGMPARIGPYVIKRRVASGGMGTIYEGVQEQPRRPVAVKVMKHGVASREALRRFQYEAQLLARLRHPGIAQVYEAGTHDDGAGPVPYFAMEYIPNAKFITRYADEKKLDVRARLELFAKACDAVHHGHQKGIIHRDLKPSNILVDSTGMPRIIDFGVARATDSDMALATVQTEVGQLVGSLQYMSPEQFEADPHDIDTRSDVYALGVVLYELLGGQLPYDVSSTTVFEAAKMVREKEPTRLGVRRPALRGEVETIVHKALAKDRDQRYQSAHGLAQDIHRYLAGEAIAARPPSLAYQFRVFARRNRALLGAVAAVFAVLVGASVVSTAMYVRAEAQRARAEAETAKSQATVEFMRGMLETAVPDGFGTEPRIVDLLDMSRREAGDAFKDEPAIEAEIRRSLGYGYVNLGQWEDAEKEWARAVELRRDVYGENDPHTIESLKDLAIIPEVLGRNEELLRIQQSIVDAQGAVLGPDHEETLNTLFALTENQLAAGRLAEAEASARRTVQGFRVTRGPDDLKTLGARAQHAWALLMQGNATAAEQEGRTLLEQCRRTLGDRHNVTRLARSVLAGTFITEGKFDEAREVYGDLEPPADPNVIRTFQGRYDSRRPGTQLLVFWETWCPFSQRAVPELENVYERYRSHIQVVGITRGTRSSTDSKIQEFIASNRISYPMVKEDGGVWKALGVSGTPWITIVRDGKVVWEKLTNTPQVMPEPMLQALARDRG